MASTDPPETQHRIKVRILVVFASILAFLAIFTSWIDRQALNTDRWVDTSGKLLEDKTISDAVASYTVDQLYANVDVSAVIKQRLPKDVQQFSAPLAAGVRQFATRAAEQAIQSPRIQQAWKDANRIAHTQLVSILKGNNEVVSSQNGKVVLNLRPLVLQLADRIGLKKQLDQKLPPDVGQLEVADSKDLDTARTVTKLIEGLSWFFTFGSVAFFGLAVYLAKGRRWMVLLAYGLGLMAAGLGRDRSARRSQGSLRRLSGEYRSRQRAGEARLGHRDLAPAQHRDHRDHLRRPLRARRLPCLAIRLRRRHPAGARADASQSA